MIEERTYWLSFGKSAPNPDDTVCYGIVLTDACSKEQALAKVLELGVLPESARDANFAAAQCVSRETANSDGFVRHFGRDKFIPMSEAEASGLVKSVYRCEEYEE